MCGIAGQLGSIDDGFVDAAVSRLRHRGPDGHGVWRDEGVALVHTRLAIIDLTDTGSQPMPYVERTPALAVSGAGGEDLAPTPESHVLVFNGEIYNHAELRAELERDGEEFVGGSDTEVLLRLLVRYGEACLPRLAGMFAFAFWDQHKGEVLLARDPLGIKPLYYRLDAGRLTFASESRVLQKNGDACDSSALRDFFLWGSVPEPATLNAAVRQLSAGHLMRWMAGRSEIHAWYDGGLRNRIPSDSVNSRSPHRTVDASLDESIALTRQALLESMRRHLVADVPVGIFLSGGIDSTVILALAREVLGPRSDIRTFSIGFDHPTLDESSLAKRTAEHFGTTHTEWRMTAEAGAAEIPAFLAAVDQPSIDGFNTWCVSKLAQTHGMKVVLSGLGGDEIFAGYSSFVRVPQFQKLWQTLGPLRPLVGKMLQQATPASPWRRLGDYFSGSGTWFEGYHAQRGIFTRHEAELLAFTLSASTASPVDWQGPGLASHPREIVSFLEVTRYMRNQLLRDSDVFSMAHGLELRVPFVDAKLLETIRVIPCEQRLQQGKKILLQAVPEVPAWIRQQPKRGFVFPFQQWMQAELGDMLDHAKKVSPVPLKAWYRHWAVAAALRAMDDQRSQ